MFMNFWYAALRSEALADRPAKLRMLGHDFVLFRDQAGAARCLSNVCVHRGGSLGDGRRLDDGTVQCPYHGWRFDGEGRCTRIPSLGANGRVPGRARVDAYPVVERYGLVFVFLGDQPEAGRPPILDIPEWDRPGWRSMSYTYDWAVHFQRSVENSLDAPHVDFVHDFGAMNNSSFRLEPERSVVEERPWGAALVIETKTQRFEDGHCGVSHTWTWLSFTKADGGPRFLFYTFITPIDEGRVRRFLVQARNTQLDPKIDAQLRPANDQAEREDRTVIESLAPRVSPADTTHEFMVEDDGIMFRYRQKLAEWTARGWRIDSAAVRREGRRTAFAIPGPSRREGGSWVLDPVPRIPAGAESVQWNAS